MLTLDAILVVAGILAFVLLIGVLIDLINDFYKESKSNEIEDYSSLIIEEDTNINIM